MSISRAVIIKCDSCKHQTQWVHNITVRTIKRHGWAVRRDGATFCPTCKAAKKHLPECCFCGSKKRVLFAVNHYTCVKCWKENNE